LKHHRWIGIHHQHVEQEQLFSSMENFLSSSGPLSNATRRTMLSYIPPRDISDHFIELYLEVIEPSHQILHLPSFRDELGAFWDRPSTADDGWLALVFVLLALGCQLHNPPQPAGQGTDFIALPSRLFNAAQTFLQRTPFMIRPDMTSIRTLCLFVIFKQARGAVCIESAALWPVTGLIVRLAITMGLHRTDSAQYAPTGADSTSSRNKLWAAVALLDLRQTLAAGMPVIPPSGDLLTEPLFGIRPGLSGATEQKAFLFPLIIYNYLPQIFKILELATSPQISLSYSLVIKYDSQIKALLTHFHNSFLSACVENPNTDRFQWIMINVFIRRILLALHSQLYQELHVLTRYPVSYWSSLESSLSILSAQRDLWDTDTGRNTSPLFTSGDVPPGRTAFVARLFQQDFFLAAVTVCFHLVQAQSPLSSPKNCQKCQIRARRTILELLVSCRDIWERERDVSVCHGTAFGMIDSLLRIVEKDKKDERDGEMEAGVRLHGEGCVTFCLGQWGEPHGGIQF
jgi:Fungal specific transcription factor domain